MVYRISKSDKKLQGTIHLTASKSESNRILLIQALNNAYSKHGDKQRFRITNLADSQDTQILAEILKNETSGDHSRALKGLDVEVSYYTGAGGTTIRFLTAFFAAREGTRILSGSDRMNQRPIKPLVDSLVKLGAKITYLGIQGCPPVKIEGTKLAGGDIEMDASVSSQFITALLLIAPVLENGLNIKLKGRIVSRSYIMMTLKILEHFGIQYTWKDTAISIPHQQYQGWDYHIESDWSAASYWYEMAALAEESDLKIKGLKINSIQGDSVIADVFQFFGVRTEFTGDGIKLSKTNYRPDIFCFDFTDYPDTVQAVAVVASILKIPILLNGLHTLRIKETDRIKALQQELKKIGVNAEEKNDASLEINPLLPDSNTPIDESPWFNTYDDHRMAMAFAPLSLIYPKVKIENPLIVQKSYPDFWNDLQMMGFEVKEE